ncbi:MAG: hypothetical protein JSW06_00905 [Thermoplasmatales archaeon]|nr:MAG: hypothetical protein JSW06_00905 [Thermoplasmatales archaeon]
MTVAHSKLPFVAIVLLACAVLFLSIWSIVYEDQWLQSILALYGVLIILLVVLVSLSSKKKPKEFNNAAKEFKKTLGGKLYHFKCPSCNGIFAIKKSKRDNKKPFKLTCPDCGNVGSIPTSPKLVVEKIPKQKSVKKRFECKNCGEFVSIWAEGTNLFHAVKIHSCPYCGKKQSMDII